MRILFAALALLGACQRAPDAVTLHIGGRDGLQLAAAELEYRPRSNVVSARLDALGWLTIERRDSKLPLTVSAPALCPVTIPAGPQAQPAELRPVIELPAGLPPLGFDARFTLRAEHACPERGRGQISWRQLEGPPLAALEIAPDGFQLSARTLSLAAAHPEPMPPGVVAFSPRNQGRVLLEASWRGAGTARLVRTVDIRATSRATGLSSVAVSQQLVLSSASWHVTSAPQGGHARVHASAEHALFTPDAPGRWQLADEAGRALTLQALWHDKTPYDCGRSECHAQIAQAAQDSPMSHAFERVLSASPEAVSCSLGCHVLGERGLGDGGFLDLAHELGWSPLARFGWNELPRALRRAAGVRCTACHGPGAIPEPQGRAKVLRVDVCATCHDAPPRYVHVEQWRGSRMSRADARAETREAGCANCHTTAGFLAEIGARALRAEAADSEPAGITCAACHAPHAQKHAAHLLRAVAGGLCEKCHSPVAGELRPAASSAVLWSGRASVPGAVLGSWEPKRGPAAHGGIACVSCHGAGADKLDHTFKVQAAACAGCHGGARREPPGDLHQRARALAARLRGACGGTGHALGAAESCGTPELDRARYEVELVLEDPAAGVHNAAFARILLDDAEAAL